jgi:NTP pyrophosphatase (non-canonical NTP hydrolase)
MDFIEYQKQAQSTAVYPAAAKVVYPALGLANEAGEVLGKIKKIIRDKGGNFEDQGSREEISSELGDVLWYIATLCNDLDLDMDDVATHNIMKLHDRSERNQLHGEGDNR